MIFRLFIPITDYSSCEHVAAQDIQWYLKNTSTFWNEMFTDYLDLLNFIKDEIEQFDKPNVQYFDLVNSSFMAPLFSTIAKF